MIRFKTIIHERIFKEALINPFDQFLSLTISLFEWNCWIQIVIKPKKYCYIAESVLDMHWIVVIFFVMLFKISKVHRIELAKYFLYTGRARPRGFQLASCCLLKYVTSSVFFVAVAVYHLYPYMYVQCTYLYL